MTGERESPLSRSHTTRRGGASSGQTLRGPIPPWDPPLSLGRFMSGGSQKCPPRFNYTTNLYTLLRYRPPPCSPWRECRATDMANQSDDR